MARKDITKQLQELTSKYEGGLNMKSAEYDEEKGKLVMQVSVNAEGNPSDLPPGVEVVSKIPASHTIGTVEDFYPERSNLSRIYVDPLSRQDLDLAKSSVIKTGPSDLYSRAIDYYHTKEVYGSAVDILTNFAAKGFENDIDDKKIKEFFDNWVLDVGFDEIVEKIFFDFFRVGLVITYKVLGPYKPKINHLGSTPRSRAHKEESVRVNRFSKNFIPVGYTIFNPTLIVVDKSSFFGQSSIYLKSKAGDDIRELLKRTRTSLNEQEKRIIDALPNDIKSAIRDNKDIPLDPDLIGQVYYRKQPYETYPFPKGSRSFEALEFKNELRKADYSTLDGISNYILKITVGSDDHPVEKQEILDRVGQMFDTTSKSFKVVWNHTLNVEKITSPEIGDILGPDKYTQVNGDVTGGLGVIRALIDGLGEPSAASADLAVKSIIEEISYARRQVARWIAKEYASVAKVVGFNRIPKVRFDDMSLRDEIKMMSIVQGMIDRRIISYRTGQKKLGFDPDTELSQMKEEFPLVQKGTLGIIGSPFQQSGRAQNVQNQQRTPRGTPSEGRPPGRPENEGPSNRDVTVTAGADFLLEKEEDDFVQKILSLPEEKLKKIYSFITEESVNISDTELKPKKTRNYKKSPQKEIK